MYRLISLIILLMIPMIAASAQQAFVPITIDAAKYAEVDQAMAKLSMPRDAHVAWMRLWQDLERQAQQEEAAKNRPPAPPPHLPVPAPTPPQEPKK